MTIRVLRIIPFFVLFSCGYNDEERDLVTELLSISERTNPTQVFKISPNTDTVIVGTQGTEIFIQANSFVTKNDEAIKSDIALYLKEIYKTSDMILNGLSTTSDDGLLETSGMMNLTAKSMGNDLKLTSERPIKIRFQKRTDSPYMRTYLGVFDSESVNWSLDLDNVNDTIEFQVFPEVIIPTEDYSDYATTDTLTYGVVGMDTFLLDSSSYYMSYPFYQLHTTKLNWINCDFFIVSPDNLELMIALPDLSRTKNFLIFKDYNSIMDSWESVDGINKFKNIPRGSQVNIFSISQKGKDYYFASLEKTIEIEDERIKLDYKPATLEEIEEHLRTFDEGI